MFVRPLWILCGLLVASSNAQVAEEDVLIDLDDPVVEDSREDALNGPDDSMFTADKQLDRDADAVSNDTGENFESSDEYISGNEEEEAPDTTNDRTNDEPSPIKEETRASTQRNDEPTIKEEEQLVETTNGDHNIVEGLEGLSNDELEAVCLDRGFEIRKGDGTPLTREDLIEAATRCLKLDEEMNTVLEENPELALELDAEIERMKDEKERLEAEKAAMLEEKSRVEEQLREAGINFDPGETKSSKGTSLSATTTDAPETLEEVLRTSFTMLFERVGNDIMLVGKVLGYVARPAGGTVALAWRYVGPTIEGFIQQGLILVDSLLSTAPAAIVRGVMENQLVPVRNVLWTIAKTTTRQAVAVAKLGLVKLNTIEPASKILVIAGAILGPLKNSLLIGWRNTLRPNISVLRRKSGAWFQRIRSEVKAKAEA